MFRDDFDVECLPVHTEPETFALRPVDRISGQHAGGIGPLQFKYHNSFILADCESSSEQAGQDVGLRNQLSETREL